MVEGMGVDVLADRRVRALLERLAADAAAGALLDAGAYVALFPDLEQQVREELAALRSPEAGGGERVGSYRLLSELGRGGQGVVWLARDERIGREVALKLMGPSFGGAEVPTSARREVEALARLDHPHLGTVYEVGSADGHVFLAMRYVAGGALSEHIARLGGAADKGELARCVECVARLARALHAAHEAGVVHRDVKPDNVLLGEDGAPVLVDFGLARAERSEMPSLTATGDLIGTPHYMAPERLRGEGYADPRGDVWSLGAVLYEWITGRRAFDGPTLENIARRVECEEPLDPARLSRACSRDLAVVCLTALEKRTERRYASALDFAEELERVAQGKPIEARPISMLGRVARWSSRNPAPASLVLVLALGLLATALAARSFQRLALDERQARERADLALAQSAWDQLQLVRAGSGGDRRWRLLQLAREVAPHAGAQHMPTRLELRNAVVESLLLPGVRRVQQLDGGALASGFLSRDGGLAVLSWLGTGASEVHARWFDLESGADRVLAGVRPGIPLEGIGALLHVDAASRSLSTTRFDGMESHSVSLELDEEAHASRMRPELLAADREGECALLYATVNYRASEGRPAPPAARFFVAEVESGATLRVRVPRQPTRVCALSEDGRRALLPLGPREFELVDLARDEVLCVLELPAAARACSLDRADSLRSLFLIEGREAEPGRLLAFDARGALVLDAVLPRPAASPSRLQSSPSGEWLAYQDEQRLTHVLDGRDGRPLLTLPWLGGGAVDGYAFRGERELVVLERGLGVRAFELEDAREFVQGASALEPLQQAAQFRVRVDSGLGLTREDGESLALESPPGMHVARVNAHTFAFEDGVLAAAVMAIAGGEGLLEASRLGGGGEGAGARLLVWDSGSGELLFDVPYGAPMEEPSLALEVRRGWLAVLDGAGELSLFDLDSEQLLLRCGVLEGAARQLRFEQQGALLAIEPALGPPRRLRVDRLWAELERLELGW